MTTLEAVSIEQILNGDTGSGRQIENLAPKEIARVMVAIQALRRDRIREIRRLSVEVADLVEQATKIRAREFLATEGPQDQRTQASKLAAAEAVFASEAKKAELEACRETLKLLKDDWDTCRSINANERAERSAIEGYGS